MGVVASQEPKGLVKVDPATIDLAKSQRIAYYYPRFIFVVSRVAILTGVIGLPMAYFNQDWIGLWAMTACLLFFFCVLFAVPAIARRQRGAYLKQVAAVEEWLLEAHYD